MQLPDMQGQFRNAAQILGKLVTDLRSDTPPEPAALLARLEHVQAEIRALGAATIDLPRAGRGLVCAACLQEAADATARGQRPAPAGMAVTVANGLALCADRHGVIPQAPGAGLIVAQAGVPPILPGSSGLRSV